MKPLTCEMCGSTDLIKKDGVFVCQCCGTKYSVEEAKKLMIAGTVNIQGTVTVDNSALIDRYLQNAHRAREKEDWLETEKYYNMVEQYNPTDIEAIFYSTFAKVKSALLEAETSDKRRGVFNILEKSISIIVDNYDNTNENDQKLLFEIMDDIKSLKDDNIVPTTHLQEYEAKNDQGDIIDRSQIIENDSLQVTYSMIHKAFETYMDSLADIIVEFSPEPVINLFLKNLKNLPMNSKIFEKVSGYIKGYRTPNDVCAEISNQVKVDKQTTLENINAQINELAKIICPFYMNNGKLWANLRNNVYIELRKLHPDSKALKSGGCYIATAVYGSYNCPEVWTLRRFRDNTLAKTRYGRIFIHVYYTISPMLVKWFGHTNWFKKMWKGKLDRMVSNLNADGVENTPYEDNDRR